VTHDSDVDTDDVGHVIVSFTIATAAPLDNPTRYLRSSQARGAEFVYDLGTERFEEPVSALRADKLDATINLFLELVESTPPRCASPSQGVRSAVHDLWQRR